MRDLSNDEYTNTGPRFSHAAIKDSASASRGSSPDRSKKSRCSGLPALRQPVHAELKRQRLIRPGAFPYRHRETDCLEIQEERRQRVSRQRRRCLLRIEIRFARQRMRLDPLLSGIQQLIRHFSQVRDPVTRDVRLRRLRPNVGQPRHRILDRVLPPLTVLQEATRKRIVAVFPHRPDRFRRLPEDRMGIRKEPNTTQFALVNRV